MFQAIRANAIRRIGLPTFPGSDDGAFASYFAFAGFRSIQVEDVLVREPMRGSQFLTKTRRAQHVLLNLLLTKDYAKKKGVYVKSQFELVWNCEFWLNVISPWLLVFAVCLLALSISQGPTIVSLSIALIALLLLGLKTYRGWVLQQVYLTLGGLRNFFTRTEVWGSSTVADTNPLHPRDARC